MFNPLSSSIQIRVEASKCGSSEACIVCLVGLEESLSLHAKAVYIFLRALEGQRPVSATPWRGQELGRMAESVHFPLPSSPLFHSPLTLRFAFTIGIDNLLKPGHHENMNHLVIMKMCNHFHNFILLPEDKTDGNNYTASACKHIELTYNALKKLNMFSSLDFAYLALWGIYGKFESYLL